MGEGFAKGRVQAAEVCIAQNVLSTWCFRYKAFVFSH